MAETAGSIEVEIVAKIGNFLDGMKQSQDELSRFTQRAQSWMDAVRNSAIAAFVVTQVKQAVVAYGEQEQAIVRLTTALGNQGIKSKASVQSLIDFSSAMERTTTFSDEAIQGLETQLVTYGLYGEKLKETTKLALDFSSATGRDLASSALILGKAFQGETGSLSRYGIVIDETIPKSQRFDKVMQLLNERYAGQAEAIRGTLLGQLQGLQNSYNNLQEEVGAFLASPGIGFTKWLDEVIVKDTEAIHSIRMMAEEMGGLGKVIVSALLEYLKEIFPILVRIAGFIPGLGPVIEVLGNLLQKQITNKIDGVISEVQKTDKQVAKTAKGAQDHINKTHDVLDKAYKSAAQMTEERVRDAQHAFDRIASFDQSMIVQMQESIRSWGVVFADTVMQGVNRFASGMAEVIVHGGSFSDALKKIGQDILQYFIEEVIKKMVVAWILGMAQMAAASGNSGLASGLMGMASGVGGGAGAGAGAMGGMGMGGLFTAGLMANLAGFGAGSYLGGHIYGENSSQAGANWGAGIGTMLFGPLGGVMGGLVGGGGHGISVNLKNAASGISKSVKKMFSGGILGEKSLIIGMESGATAVAGEKGPEALVSFENDLGMNPQKARRRLMGDSSAGSSSSGGGGVNIHITGQFLEASPAKWHRMFRDTILPEVRRYTDSSPKGPFTRRRGQS